MIFDSRLKKASDGKDCGNFGLLSSAGFSILPSRPDEVRSLVLELSRGFSGKAADGWLGVRLDRRFLPVMVKSYREFVILLFHFPGTSCFPHSSNQKERDQKTTSTRGTCMRALGNRTTVLLAAAFALRFNTFNASAASKGKLPTPANFRVAAKTAYTVTAERDVGAGGADEFLLNSRVGRIFSIGETASFTTWPGRISRIFGSPLALPRLHAD